MTAPFTPQQDLTSLVRVELSDGATVSLRPQRSDGSETAGLVTVPALSRLAPPARTVFGVADAIRLAHERRGVGTDHLLLGLFADAEGPARRGAARVGVNEAKVVQRLASVGFDTAPNPVEPEGDILPRWPDPTTLEPAPLCSATVEGVVLAAERLAGARGESAPIEVADLLRALVAAADQPIVQLFADVWPHVIAALDESAPGSPFAVQELSDTELNALVPSLSASSRLALGVANALRRERDKAEVHMEHLLVGLFVQSGGHQADRLQVAGLDAPTIKARLADFELTLAEAASSNGSATFQLPSPAAGEIAEMPPLSGHVRLALSAAAALGGWDAASPPIGGLVQARLVLAGWFAVRECSVVRALEDKRSAVRDVVAAQIRTDTPPEGHSTADRLKRLDALLAEPPQFTWIRLRQDEKRDRTGAGGGGANDRADGVDRLRFTDYVNAFADLIDSPDTDPPITIGIFGAWGAGKSFLLRKLKKELDDRRKALGTATGSRRAPVYPVEFNAWEYNAATQIWPRLVRRILDSFESSLGWRARTRIRLRRLWPNLKRKAAEEWKWLVALGIIASLIALAARVGSTSGFEFTVGQTIAKLTLPGLIGAVTSLGTLLVRSFLAPIGEWITAVMDDGRSYGLESVVMASVRKDLERLDARLSREGARVLVVIDDLDRCEPEKAVEMLQAINLLLDRPSFIICLGIDARVVTAAVERHYRETLGPAGITGYEYLDKIVQIPFTIPQPTPDDLLAFLAGQLDRTKRDAPAATQATQQPAQPDQRVPDTTPVTPPPTASQQPATRSRDGAATAPNATGGSAPAPPPTASPAGGDANPAQQAAAALLATLSFSEDEKTAFQQVTPFLRRNPRHVKRLVNVYTLVRALAARRREQRILGDPHATVLWLALCAQWPYSLRQMLLHFEKHASAKPAPGPTVPPLRVLYGAARPSLDALRQTRFDHDTAVLDRLIDASSTLSWEEIAVLREYTENFNPAIEGELRAAGARRRERRRN